MRWGSGHGAIKRYRSPLVHAMVKQRSSVRTKAFRFLFPIKIL
jgi:hypothetical protein